MWPSTLAIFLVPQGQLSFSSIFHEILTLFLSPKNLYEKRPCVPDTNPKGPAENVVLLTSQNDQKKVFILGHFLVTSWSLFGPEKIDFLRFSQISLDFIRLHSTLLDFIRFY